MWREILQSFKQFVGETRAVVAAAGGSLLFFVLHAFFRVARMSISADLAAAAGMLVFLGGAFWAYHLLRLRHEAAYLDPRLERVRERQGRAKLNHPAEEDFVVADFLVVSEIPSGSEFLFALTAPVYQAKLRSLTKIGIPRGGTFAITSWDLNNVRAIVGELALPVGSHLSLRVHSPSPVRIRSVHVGSPSTEGRDGYLITRS